MTNVAASEEETPRLEGPQALAALREFLTSYPLYRKLRLPLKMATTSLEFPGAISGPCRDAACIGEPATSWSQTGLDSRSGHVAPGSYWLQYTCVHCRRAAQHFWVLVDALEGASPVLPIPGILTFGVQKIGQWPSWSIAVPREIERALEDAEFALYRKALVCMSQSYGIGALAYFRRIIENTVGELLGLVEEAATAEGDQKALAAVREARTTKVADDKLRLIREFIPASLRPGGVNPFAKLYDDYSRGIHSLSDEECLVIAAELRDTLEYVFGNIRDRLEQAKAYRAKITGSSAT